MIPVTDRIRQSLVSLHMARALETLDQILSRMEKGEMSAIEAIDALLAEELTCRSNHFLQNPRNALSGFLGASSPPSAIQLRHSLSRTYTSQPGAAKRASVSVSGLRRADANAGTLTAC